MAPMDSITMRESEAGLASEAPASQPRDVSAGTQGRFDVRRRTKFSVGVATTIAALTVAGPAQASTAADDQYGAVLGEQSGGGTVKGTGTLPFTGLDVVLVGGVGTALTAGGLVLRRAARRSAPQRS